MASKKQDNIEIAKRYAKALFSLAKEEGKLEAVEGDLVKLEELIDASADLRNLLNSPVISRASQAEAIAKLLAAAGSSDMLRRFGAVLAGHRRLAVLPQVIEKFFALLAESRNEITAEVTSAMPLQDAQVISITSSLADSLKKKIKVRKKVDPSIKGGLIIKIGSTMLDDSIKSKLERLGRISKKAVSSL